MKNLFFTFLLSLFVLPVQAGLPVAMFWRNRVPTLSFTTSAQTVLGSLCSGVMTVQNNYSNTFIAKNVTSTPLTVNLSGPAGMTFYSDASCTLAITSVSIAVASSTASFYFLNTNTGSSQITASASGYNSVTQSETINTNGFIWTGGGANTNWNTALNWSGGVAPGASNVAVFESTCASNCSPNITANMSVAGVRMATGYAGTITQNAGFTITVGTSGWVQIAGIFTGGNSAITLSGPYVLSGGTYTATSGTLTTSKNWTVNNTATFNANSGTLSMFATLTMSPGSGHYNNVIFAGCTPVSYSLNNETLNVDGTLSFAPTCGSATINSGAIMTYGNISSSAGGASGSAVITVAGNPAGQTITGAANAYFPNLVIDTGTNPVTLSGDIWMSGNLTMTSVGTFTTTGSTVRLRNSLVFTPGAVHYNNIEFAGCTAVFSLNNGTLNIDGTLSLAPTCGSATINSGAIMAYGNISSSTGSGASGSVVITVAGNPAGQTITGVTSAYFPNLVIDTGTNPVTLSGDIWMSGNLTMTSVGTFTTTGSTVRLRNSLVFTPGAVHYNNIEFAGCTAVFSLNNGTLNVDGTLSLAPTCGSGTINSGVIMAYGNISSSGGGASGSVVITVAGNAAGQTITGVTSAYFPNLVIDAGVNPVTLSGTVKLAKNFTMTSVGTFTTTGSTLYFSNSTAITITPGTVHYGDVTFGGCGSYDLSGGSMNIDGNLSLTAWCSGSTINSGTLNAYGNVSSISFWTNGSAALQFLGSNSITLTVGSSKLLPTGNITVALTGGASLILASAVSWNSAGQTTTVTSGSIDMAGFALTAKSLVLSGTTVTKTGGVLTVNGSVAGTGSLFGGTVNP
jgi:hypothetical protein